MREGKITKMETPSGPHVSVHISVFLLLLPRMGAGVFHAFFCPETCGQLAPVLASFYHANSHSVSFPPPASSFLSLSLKLHLLLTALHRCHHLHWTSPPAPPPSTTPPLCCRRRGLR